MRQSGIYTDDDSQGKQLSGQNGYSITFAKGEVPPVNGFWSVTLYNAEHFFNPNPAEAVLARHQEQDSQIQRGWLADTLCKR